MSIKIISTAALVTTLFFPLFGSQAAKAEAFNANEMRASAARNGNFCSTGWYTAGSINSVRTHPEIQRTGDLGQGPNNVTATFQKIFTLNAQAARSGNVEPLKTFLLGMMRQKHFTRLGRYVPETYYGKRYDWFATYPPYQETLYYVGPLMQSAAQGVGLLKPHLSAQELQIAKGWGQELFQNSKNIKISPRAADVMSSVASGYATWAAVTNDRQIMRQAQQLYKQALNGINRQGIHDLVARSGTGKEERELKYTHMIYGFMTVAAWAIEESGGKAFSTRGSSGGTLIDGLNFHLAASFFPDRRQGISPIQKEIDYTRRSRDVYWSLGYLEFAKAAGITSTQIPLLDQIITKIGSNGFFNGSMGGYSSCLHRG